MICLLVTGGVLLGATGPEGAAESQVPIFFEPVETTKELIVAIIILALAIQTNEDLTCIFAGILVSDGFIGYWWAVLACFIGIVGGDIFLYSLGRFFGGRALQWRWMKRILPEHRVAHWAKSFEERGFSLIVLSRFVPGSRFPVYFAAGMLRMASARFLIFLGLAAFVWTPFLVGVSVLLGEKFLVWFEAHRGSGAVVLIGAVVVIYLFIHKGIPLFTWRGRRLALGFWRRWFRWEFWPRWFFYPPVIVYLTWQMVKRRSFTIVTAANPGIPCGGWGMERKSDIFKGLGEAPGLPKWTLFGRGFDSVARTAALGAFMKDSGVEFPVVLKPNFGQRGNGVAMVDSADEAATYFDKHRKTEVMAQNFAEGLEFSVFYIRHPDAEKGRISSITEKRFTSVIGDGETKVENLILRDDRAVCMGKFFLKQPAIRVDDIPDEGEVVQLTELGTHCRGAEFRDGRNLHTPELEAAIDGISRHYEGFYFGRYDIRVPTVEDFQAGKNLRIIEVDGLNSEPTHIYEPGFSLREAYRTLCRHWDEAFEIAEKNCAEGAKPLSVRESVALLKRHFFGRC